MQELNLPYVIEAFEKKRPRKPQQQVANSRATASTARRGQTPAYRSSGGHDVRG